MNKKRKINSGCGSRIHPDWINFDFISRDKEVTEVDLRKRIPVRTDWRFFEILERIQRNTSGSETIKCLST